MEAKWEEKYFMVVICTFTKYKFFYDSIKILILPNYYWKAALPRLFVILLVNILLNTVIFISMCDFTIFNGVAMKKR